MLNIKKLSVIAFILLMSIFSCREDRLMIGFQNPPEATKPWVYWYWISDNISRDGITRDLEAMARVGIGEALIGNIFLEEVTPGPVKALTEEWWGMVEHAIREGDRLGVKIGLFNCPGWSQSGGPWIKPEQAMRYIVTSETRVQGPINFKEKLPIPKEPFQDIAVLAFPTPMADQELISAYLPRLRFTPTATGIQNLIDNNYKTAFIFPEILPADKKSYSLDIALNQAVTVRSLVLYPAESPFIAQCELQVPDTHQAFRTIRSFKIDRSNPSVNVGAIPYAPIAITFPAVKSAQFRLIFNVVHGKVGFAEIELSGAARLESYIEKQLAKMHPTPLPMWDTYLWPPSTEPENANLSVAPQQIQNISQYLTADGTLNWEVPAGKWTILRMGMTPTGTKNSPASPEAQGLEVDKMNRQAAEAHFEAYAGQLVKRIPAAERKAWQHLVADSYEMGSQNWTDGFREIFIQQYGYDPLPWLPTLTGRIVGSADQSDRFLWDLRRLVADRVAYDYVGGLREISHRNGLKVWLENYGHWGFPAEFLQYGGQADHISGEFWATGDLGSIELRAASSASHIYGMPITSAEAFTGGPHFVSHPYSLKCRGDWAYSEGINHFVLHVYIHQPWEDKKPGVNAWFGTEFNRHNTWFEASRSWIDYLRRCHFLLQEGKYVADVAYFIGEDVPKMTGVRNPELPAGYSFDHINAEVILNRLQVKDGRFILPDGMSWSVLVLPELKTMRPAVLEKIRDLVAAGGTILGAPPLHSPSMQDYPACDRQVSDLAAEIWQNCDGNKIKSVRFGQGRVFKNVPVKSVLDDLKVGEDMQQIDPKQILWIHRATPDVDIYFLSNQTDAPAVFSPHFRVMGKMPEFWYPESGRIFKTAQFKTTATGIELPITLEARGSVFVVFRKSMDKSPVVAAVTKDNQPFRMNIEAAPDGALTASIENTGTYTVKLNDGRKAIIKVETMPAPLEINAAWDLCFPPDMDAPGQITFDHLVSWSEHENSGVKYFAGTAVYSQSFEIPADYIQANQKLILDLGQVSVMAEVILNDKNIGVLWKPPFMVDVTDIIKEGSNSLEVRVTNTWHNRLVGDAKYPDGLPGQNLADNNKTSRFKTFLASDIKIKPDAALEPSGLLGPVRIIGQKLVRLSSRELRILN